MAARAADLSSVQGVFGCGRVDEGLCDRDRAAGVLGDRGYTGAYSTALSPPSEAYLHIHSCS